MAKQKNVVRAGRCGSTHACRCILHVLILSLSDLVSVVFKSLFIVAPIVCGGFVFGPFFFFWGGGAGGVMQYLVSLFSFANRTMARLNPPVVVLDHLNNR